MPQTEKQETHRPGIWKQQNKSHKNGRHRSNREIQSMAKGKVSIKVVTKCKKKELNRDQRRHLMKQKRQSRREETIAIKRSIGSENKPPILVLVHSPHGYVNVKPILELFKNCSEDVSFGNGKSEHVSKDRPGIVHVSKDRPGIVHVSIPKFKLRYQFIHTADGDLFGLMDAAKVADLLLLVHSLGTDPEDDLLAKDQRLSAIYFHFLPTTIHVVNGLDGVPVKRRAEIKKNVFKAIETRFPDEKLHTIDGASDALQFLHILGNCKRKINAYKKNRAQILAENFEFIPQNFGLSQLGDNPSQGMELEGVKLGNGPSGETMGKLIVSGYVRNRTLSANSLLHIPGFGDFQMEMIESSPDPHPISKRSSAKAMDIENGRTLLQKSDPMVQEPLEFENEPDPMEGEQSYPTAEEIAAAAEEVRLRKKKIKKVAAGTSDYQAAWIVDNESDHENGNESDNENGNESDHESEFDTEYDEDDNEMNLEPKDEENEFDNESDHDNESLMTTNDGAITTCEDNDERYDEKIDIDAEAEELKKMKEARENQLFPDEVDTPMDVPARIRFARYRGLQSFSHSDWDPKENLPSDYSRIFQFEHFPRTKARLLKELKSADRKSPDESVGAPPGTFAHVTLINVPISVYNHFKNNPLKPMVIFSLLAHEQRMSVLNFVLHKSPSYAGVIKSKERLIFHVGCRRFSATPIFSAHTNGNKFKYERFLKEDDVTVASVYAPITFPPASVVVFKESPTGVAEVSQFGCQSESGFETSDKRVRFDSQSDQNLTGSGLKSDRYPTGSGVKSGQNSTGSGLKLVATGSLLSVDPDRLVIKRIVLSGHPFKINRRSAVIRYMFYNKEDINWFKPVQLRTKFGRKGHIMDSLGTHGHMKVTFDTPINSMDTILMNLYKRVFPKWTYDPFVREPQILDHFDEEMED